MQYKDTRSRWPYLGNAFKYAFAQSVIMFGVFKPHLRNPLTDDEIPFYQAVWITTFVCSTLYRCVCGRVDVCVCLSELVFVCVSQLLVGRGDGLGPGRA